MVCASEAGTSSACAEPACAVSVAVVVVAGTSMEFICIVDEKYRSRDLRLTVLWPEPDAKAQSLIALMRWLSAVLICPVR